MPPPLKSTLPSEVLPLEVSPVVLLVEMHPPPPFLHLLLQLQRLVVPMALAPHVRPFPLLLMFSH